MDKPRKKTLGIVNDDKEILALENFKDGYNQACDDWESFLPDVEEIVGIVNECIREINSCTPYDIALSIAKRIRKGG